VIDTLLGSNKREKSPLLPVNRHREDDHERERERSWFAAVGSVSLTLFLRWTGEANLETTETCGARNNKRWVRLVV
jgi:hypothetical protein